MQFITVPEAMELTNKSQSTISNFCRKFKGTEHIKRTNNIYYIDKNFLLEYYKINIKTNIKEPQKELVLIKQIEMQNEIIDMLKAEISEKNKQISELHILMNNQTKVLPERIKTKTNKTFWHYLKRMFFYETE